MSAETKDINFFDIDLKHAFNVENVLKPEEFFSVIRKGVPLGEYEMNYKFDYVLGNSCFTGTLVKYRDNYQKTNFCRIADKTLHFIIFSRVGEKVVGIIHSDKIPEKILPSSYPVQQRFAHGQHEIFKAFFHSYLQEWESVNKSIFHLRKGV